jgi:hypothetical protein
MGLKTPTKKQAVADAAQTVGDTKPVIFRVKCEVYGEKDVRQD